MTRRASMPCGPRKMFEIVSLAHLCLKKIIIVNKNQDRQIIQFSHIYCPINVILNILDLTKSVGS